MLRSGYALYYTVPPSYPRYLSKRNLYGSNSDERKDKGGSINAHLALANNFHMYTVLIEVLRFPTQSEIMRR